MKLNNAQLTELADIAMVAAQDAAAYIQSKFDQHYVKYKKVGGDSIASQLVTEVDRQSQEIILAYLAPTMKAFDLGLLTEESEDDHSRLEKDYFWCIDPLDGTLPFTENRTGYAVSIALVAREGQSVLGVVHIPDTGDAYLAVAGQGVKHNGRPWDLAKGEDQDIRVFQDSSFQNTAYYDKALAALEEYASKQDKKLVLHSGYGGVRSSISLLNCTAGCFFKFPKPTLGGGSIWDYGATQIIFKELGMLVSDALGAPLYLNHKDSTFLNHCGIVYSTNSQLHNFLLELRERV